MSASLPAYDIATIGAYTKDTIVSRAGTRYVNGGGYSYAAHAARVAGLPCEAGRAQPVGPVERNDGIRQEDRP